MAENLHSFQLVCRGGLNTSRDVLSQGTTSPGSAIKMVNYEPSISGGYRRISGYQNDYGTVPGIGPVLGVVVADNVNEGILAARQPTTGYDYLYYWDSTLVDWVSIPSVGTVNVVDITKVRFERVNWFAPSVVIADGTNPASVYDGTTLTQITDTNAPTAPKFVAEFNKHLFLTQGSNLYFSAPYSTTDFSPALGAGVINVGFEIVQIKAFRNILYIFGLTAIKKLTGTNISDFVVDDVTKNLGCMASDSIVEMGGDLLFLSQDGFRPVSGTSNIGDVNLETISKDIQSVFTDFAFVEDLQGLSSVTVRQKSQFRIFFASTSAQGIVGGIRPTDTGLAFEFGLLLGFDVTCASSGYLGQYEYVISGSSDGTVNRQDRGSSFNGADIFSLFQTPYLHMDDPEVRKNIYSVSTYLRSEGDNNIVLGITYDYEDSATLNPVNYTMTTTGSAAYFNEALYDSTAIFDGNPAPVHRTNVSGSGKSVSLRYVTNDTNASHTLQGMVVTYGLGDRR